MSREKARFGGSLGNIGANPKVREALETAKQNLAAKEEATTASEPEDEAVGGIVASGSLLKDDSESEDEEKNKEQEDIGTARTEVAVSSVPPPPQPVVIPPAPQTPSIEIPISTGEIPAPPAKVRENAPTMEAPLEPVAPPWDAQRISDSGSLPPTPPAEPSVWLEPDDETRGARDAEALEYEREEQRVLEMPAATPFRLWWRKYRAAIAIIVTGLVLMVVAGVSLAGFLEWYMGDHATVAEVTDRMGVPTPDAEPAPHLEPTVIDPAPIPPALPPPPIVVTSDPGLTGPSGTVVRRPAREAFPTTCATAGRQRRTDGVSFLCGRNGLRGNNVCNCEAVRIIP